MKKILLITILITFTCCESQNRDNEKILLPCFQSEKALSVDLSDPFFSKVRKVALETNDSSLIGNINKIVKSDHGYYILSDDKVITLFDHNGMFLSRLDRLGNGPGEYRRIGDFNILSTESGEELWLCDFNSISIYKLNLENKWQFMREIQFNVVINKFSLLSDGKLILMTGQEEESLAISDTKGEIYQHFLKKEIPFLTFKSVQFIPYDAGIIFPLGQSNRLVYYSLQTDSFTQMSYVAGNSLLSDKKLLELFDKYEYDYLREIANFSYIMHISESKGRVILDIFSKGSRYFYFKTENEAWKYIQYKISDHKMFPLSTIRVSQSKDSFILFGYENEESQSNPYILEL